MRTTCLRSDSAPQCTGIGHNHPEPVLSSKDRNWHGLTAELYRVGEVDVVAEFPQHTVTMHFRSGVDLMQGRYGRLRRSSVRAGDILVTAAGESKMLRHEQQAELLKIRLAPEFVEEIARQGDLADAGHVLIKDNPGTRDEALAHTCKQLRAELEHESVGSRLYVGSLAIQLVV